MSDLRGPTHDGQIPLRAGLGDGGVDTLRAAVRGRNRHVGSLQRMARDCGVVLETLESFCYGHADLPVEALKKVAEYIYSNFRTYDPATDALVKVERPPYVMTIDRASAETAEWFRNKPDRPEPRQKTQIERISEETGKRFLENHRSK